jgi:hypothetical protein
MKTNRAVVERVEPVEWVAMLRWMKKEQIA